MARKFAVNHAFPGKFWLDYILLPYGEFYDKTKPVLQMKKGELLRFFNGPEIPIDSVALIAQDALCDFLCRMRYGISWKVALDKWVQYARLQGYSKDIISTEKCILVVFSNDRN